MLDHWHEIEDLFQKALEFPAPERGAFLAKARQGGETLRREVERLLVADEKAASFLERGAVEDHPELLGRRHQERTAVPEWIGPYQILELLGEGGMGTVYLAEQRQPIARQVALKLIRPALFDRQALLRFQAERQALARMSHPHIAQVFEAGTSADGQPYLVMEYVAGRPITHYCDQKKLGIKPRLELFIRICEAVQHLHQKGIIHRDLKPSNILVQEEQGRAIPKIIDFGIAKALDQPLTEATLITGDRLLGTPTYLSPEAIESLDKAADFDTRSDVYALGVLLYELLVGVVPFGEKGDSWLQILRRIREEEAVAPSRRCTRLPKDERESMAVHRGVRASNLCRHLRGDLDWIALKALFKARAERYASAAELARDVDRALHHMPVVAGPPTRIYLLRKFFRRHAMAIAASMAIFLTLLLGLIATSQQARKASREARAAQEISQFLVDLFQVAGPQGVLGDTLTAEVLLERGIQRIESLDDLPITQARLLHVLGGIFLDLASYDRAAEVLDRALRLRHEHLGPEHPDTASTLYFLGHLHREQGRFGQARAFYARSLSGREQSLGVNSAAVAEALNGLGQLEFDLGHYSEAVLLNTRAIAIWERSPPGGERSLASALNNLGMAYRELGRYAEAEECYSRSIVLKRQLLEPDHPSLTQTLENLAVLYGTQGRYAAAEPLLEQTLEARLRVFGAEHSITARNLGNLATCYLEQTKYGQAEVAAERALEINEKIFGPDHPTVAQNLNNLASIYRYRGQAQRARPLLERAVNIVEKALGSQHQYLGLGLRNLGEVYRELGEATNAQAALERSFEILEAALGREHPQTAKALDDLARLYCQQGPYTADEALGQQIMNLPESSGPMHPGLTQVRQTVACRQVLARGEGSKK